MSGKEIRTRSDRVAQLRLPPGQFAKLLAFFQQGEVISRLALCVVAALVMWTATIGWRPPFPYRVNQVPPRDIISRVTFERKDEAKTQEARQQARRETLVVYRHDPSGLIELRQALKDKVDQLLRAENYTDVAALWSEFYEPPKAANETTQTLSAADAFEAFRQAVNGYAKEDSDEPPIHVFEIHVERAFRKIEDVGLLQSLQHELGEGLQTRITVMKQNGERRPVEVNGIRISAVSAALKADLESELESPVVASYVFNWLAPRLPETLKKDEAETQAAAALAANEVEEVNITYQAGRSELAAANEPLKAEQVELLREEYQAVLNQTPWWIKFARDCSTLGMFIALYALCGVYLYYRRFDLLRDFRKLAALQLLVVLTVATARMVAGGEWQLELVPLLLFGMTAAIAYQQEIAFLLTAAVSLVVVLSLGQGMDDFVTWTATLAVAILLLRHVRSRTKLIYVGLAAAAVAFFTALGVGLVVRQQVNVLLFVNAGWYALIAAISGVLMTGILPFVEGLFDVQTEISLLELGDVAHPLLQELVRRAPGTYNHSINVASIAEAAADSIGANGLLLRVGAYFHDIGKMLKPQYFVENQGGEGNRHETLLPAMSTLIIIAHVKDGADLARKHHLPQPLIDLILQHHGTTLVEYFYSQASKRSEEDPEAGQVDEGSYRYPGPKPQTREAAVLMLSDAVESAARSLTEPAPARIENLVHQIAMKRLLDGQFDECGLTLQELRSVEMSLVKSLTGIYHSRIKYPDQQRA